MNLEVVLNDVNTSEDVVPTTPLLVTCPEGWSLFGGHCYKFNQALKTWKDAEATCQSEGGHLASIHNADENKFVNSKVL